MMNMGFTRLRLVAPENVDAGRVLERAVHAGPVWHAAQTFATLREALAGCSFVAGATRRRGEKRKSSTMSARELAGFIRGRKAAAASAGASAAANAPVAAVVFGNERAGLDSGELALCDIATHIPVSGAFPSLNLSHAVQIYCYELALALAEEDTPPEGRWVPLVREEIEALCDDTYRTLQKFGFYQKSENREQWEFFRDIIARAALTRREADYLRRIVLKAAHYPGSAAPCPAP
jgi:tRNA/rRNA methyltransferase/tRNA (cytidine32/uridine32-2'-O)-methyltransferase